MSAEAFLEANKRSLARVLRFALVAALVLVARPSPAAPDLMNYLSSQGLHDVHDENWNLYGQFTYIYFHKPPFPASYTNANGSNSSLRADAEDSFTQTLTVYLGARLWKGAELYVAPETISELTLSNLKGIGGATENFELQKTGSPSPTFYRSRLFLRETMDFGGDRTAVPSSPLQLAGKVDSHRLVVTVGNFGFLDVFDKNNVVGDLRRSFIDEAFMTYPAWDFPADARGYSVGLAVELDWDAWVARLGRMMPPKNPNEQTLDSRLFLYYGDALEIEHSHALGGQPGAVRLLLYRNYEVMGRFSEAVDAFGANPSSNAAACGDLYNYGSGNAGAPDLCFVRSPQVKVGAGLNLEQNITSNLGVFFRGMYSDGQTEVNAFDSSDRSVSLGAVAKGALWGRPLDLAGVGLAMSWISENHGRYLSMGGVDGFIGDGHLRQATEGLGEVFYSFCLLRSFWLSADYQYLSNPGYNADRGPVNLFGGRAHVEF